MNSQALTPTHHSSSGIASTLAHTCARMYRFLAAEKSAAGFGDSESNRRTSAHPVAGAFFVPATQRYGGCAWETFGSAGFLFDRFANLRTVTSFFLARDRGDSNQIGVFSMKHARIASASRARAHRQMAIAALKSNSSLATRLKRYRHHSAKARRLEGGVV
jgi:hypothetical protein